MMTFSQYKLCKTIPGRLAGLLFLASCLGACSRSGDAGPKPPPGKVNSTAAALPVPAATAVAPVAPSMPAKPDTARDKELMQAIFEDAYNPGTGQALAVVQDEGKDAYCLMTLAASTELPDGRTVVITNGAPSDEKGNDLAGHASPGMLNVYTLRRTETGWNVLERRENVTTLGSMGNFGEVRWISLGPDKPGFIVSSGGVWQGYAISFADIFDLGHGVRHLGSVKEASSSSGACSPEKDECWDIDSSIRVLDVQADAYPDLQIDFKGKRFRVTENKSGDYVEHPKGTIQESARYRFDGKEYVLVSGINPVPDI